MIRQLICSLTKWNKSKIQFWCQLAGCLMSLHCHTMFTLALSPTGPTMETLQTYNIFTRNWKSSTWIIHTCSGHFPCTFQKYVVTSRGDRGPIFIGLLSGRFLCFQCDFHFIAMLTVNTQKFMIAFRCLLLHENKWRHNANPLWTRNMAALFLC